MERVMHYMNVRESACAPTPLLKHGSSPLIQPVVAAAEAFPLYPKRFL